MTNIINANALYREFKKKFSGIPYPKLVSAINGSDSGLPEDAKKHLIKIVRKVSNEVEANILKS